MEARNGEPHHSHTTERGGDSRQADIGNTCSADNNDHDQCQDRDERAHRKKLRAEETSHWHLVQFTFGCNWDCGWRKDLTRVAEVCRLRHRARLCGHCRSLRVLTLRNRAVGCLGTLRAAVGSLGGSVGGGSLGRSIRCRVPLTSHCRGLGWTLSAHLQSCCASKNFTAQGF